MPLFNALIRTHHITSRKKVAALKKAFSAPHNPGLTLVVLRTGASPGIMYVEGRDRAGVEGWVAGVEALRYKYFSIPGAVGDAVAEGRTAMRDVEGRVAAGGLRMGFVELERAAEFGEIMGTRGLEGWWKRAMGWDGGK